MVFVSLERSKTSCSCRAVGRRIGNWFGSTRSFDCGLLGWSESALSGSHSMVELKEMGKSDTLASGL